MQAITSRIPALLRSSVRLAPIYQRSFHAASVCMASSKTELVNNLNSEIKYEAARGIWISKILPYAVLEEEEGIKENIVPDFIQEYLQKTKYSVVDTPEDQNEVKVTRVFDDKIITITADILSDPSSVEDDEEYAEDDDENVKESAKESADEDEEMDDDEVSADGTSAVIDITKKSTPGTLSFHVTFSDEFVNINQVEFATSSADITSAEKEFKHTNTYLGPAFEELDEDLKNAFYEFLTDKKECAVDEDVSNMIQSLASYKEQVEYTRWLKHVKSFVEK